MKSAPPRLTIYDLWAFALQGTEGVGRNLATLESLALASAVIGYFTGVDWLERHINDPTSPLRLIETAPDFPERLTRFIDWGEVVFNLQETPGFDHLMERLHHNDNVDGVLGELELGRMLYLQRIPFRYVIPSGAKGGRNHDVEITMPDGLIVCADAKCKIESTDFGAATIRSTLNSGRDQLPSNEPGFIFMKVPPRWLQEPQFSETLRQTTWEFLRGTGRVVSVKYFSSIFRRQAGASALFQTFTEVSNPMNRFDQGRNWDLFPDQPDNFSWDGIPPHWQPLFRFPDGRIR